MCLPDFKEIHCAVSDLKNSQGISCEAVRLFWRPSGQGHSVLAWVLCDCCCICTCMRRVDLHMLVYTAR